MQKWIVGGVLAMVLLGGGLIGYYKLVYQPNRPAPMWVPLPIKADLPNTKRDEIIADLKVKLTADEVLVSVSKDLDLPREWNLASENEAARELKSRIFVRDGEADSPMGRVPAVLVGVTGKSKEREFTGKIAMRLMDDVWRILGIEPPPKRE